MRWTSKLVCRDLKGLAARCTNRVRIILSSTSGVPDQAVHKVTDTQSCALILQSEVYNESPIDMEDFYDLRFPCTLPSFSPSTTADSNSTLTNEVSQKSLEVPRHLVQPPQSEAHGPVCLHVPRSAAYGAFDLLRRLVDASYSDAILPFQSCS